MRFKIADLLISKDGQVEFITPIWFEKDSLMTFEKYRVYFKIGNIHKLNSTLFIGLGLILSDKFDVIPLEYSSYTTSIVFQIKDNNLDCLLNNIYKLKKKSESRGYSTEIRFKFEKEEVKRKIFVDVL